MVMMSEQTQRVLAKARALAVSSGDQINRSLELLSRRELSVRRPHCESCQAREAERRRARMPTSSNSVRFPSDFPLLGV